jgi:ABC-type amino acid transport substrate-binding protein
MAVDRELLRRVEEDARRYDDRRSFLRKSAAAIGGAGLLLGACTSSDDGDSGGDAAAAGGTQVAAAQGETESVFDRILDGGTVRLGADLTFPPLQFGTAQEPEGYAVELAVMMMEDLGAEWEIVEVPFAELFGALAAGRFDFAGIAATNLPSRAQQVMFSSFPAFIESNVILRNTDSPVTSAEDLDSSDVTIAVLVGSSQEASAAQLFPQAQLRALEQQPAVQDAATGRSDVVFLGEFNVAEVLQQNDSLEVLEGPPITADINTFFMPVGDFRMKAFVDNWLNYNAIRGTLSGMWNSFVGDAARESNIQTVPVVSPWLTAGSAPIGP